MFKLQIHCACLGNELWDLGQSKDGRVLYFFILFLGNSWNGLLVACNIALFWASSYEPKSI